MKDSTDASPIIEDTILQNIENSLKSLRIADLALFITAAQLGSLGKSAQAHHLSQSGASAAIQRVENAFGFSLCTHEKRRFRLTQEGKELLPHLEKWLEQIRNLIHSKDQTPLRLVTTHAIAQIAIPALLSIEPIQFKQMRPDHAYRAILQNEADIALVLDNAPWQGVITAEVSRGYFQLYAKKKDEMKKKILLPEDQMEVLSLKQRWQEIYGYPIPVKSTIPSWSLIADICATTNEVGFLPDFLGEKYQLHPVQWQPSPIPYRVLAIHRHAPSPLLDILLDTLHSTFIPSPKVND